MDELSKNKLNQKKADIQKRIKIDAEINSGIIFHWLDYYQEMIDFGMKVKILYLHQVENQDLELYRTRIENLENPLLKSADIIPVYNPLMDRVFDRFPSNSYFKYEIDAPALAAPADDVSENLNNAAKLLNVKPTKVLFMSNDFLPVVELEWAELLKYGHQLFNDGGRTTLVFTDPDFKWIIFRSIEEKWNYEKW